LELTIMPRICWKQSVALFVMLVAAFTVDLSAGRSARQGASASTPSLDFEFFKTRVEPIFLKRRPGHARCYICHAADVTGVTGAPTQTRYLVSLSPGSTFWTEEQSRIIFENVSKLVNPDDPMNSRILIHPLSPLAGGDMEYPHGGGRQFESKEDPDWQAIAEWVRGGKVARSSGP
jgi:hypothetical protein